MPIQIHHSLYVHPGIWLMEEVVQPHGLTISALAEHLHVTRQALSALLNGRAGLSPDMAIRFEKAFGLKADTLLRMQAGYDIRVAREREDSIKVERLAAA